MAYSLIVNSSKRIIQNVREHTEKRFEATYKGYTIVIEHSEDDTDMYYEDMWIAWVFNSEIKFGTAVDGIFKGTMDDVIMMCVENILI